FPRPTRQCGSPAAELFSESRVSSFPVEKRSHLFILQERVQIPRTLGKICGRAEATAPLPADAALRHNSRWLCFLASKPVFLRVEQFGEARIFLEEGEIFVVARVVAVFRAQLDGDLEVLECGVGFAGEAIERCQRVMNVVGLGRGLARFVEALPRFVPAPDVHLFLWLRGIVPGALGVLCRAPGGFSDFAHGRHASRGGDARQTRIYYFRVNNSAIKMRDGGAGHWLPNGSIRKK